MKPVEMKKGKTVVIAPASAVERFEKLGYKAKTAAPAAKIKPKAEGEKAPEAKSDGAK